MYVDLYGYAAVATPFDTEALLDGNSIFGTSFDSPTAADFSRKVGANVTGNPGFGYHIGIRSTALVAEIIQSASQAKNPALLLVEQGDSSEDLLRVSYEMLGDRATVSAEESAVLAAYLSNRSAGEVVDLTAYWNLAVQRSVAANQNELTRFANDQDRYTDEVSFWSDPWAHVALPQTQFAASMAMQATLATDQQAPKALRQSNLLDLTNAIGTAAVPIPGISAVGQAKRLGRAAAPRVPNKNSAATPAHNAANFAKHKELLSATESANPLVESLRNTGQLPSNYFTKAQAVQQGWRPGKALGNSLPGGQLGGDVFQNTTNILPSAQGRVWYEADIGLSSTITRAKQPGTRLLYSNDGLMYVTPDHYETVHMIGRWKD